MPKLILHIGTEKTGSSALQNYLARNKDILLEKNFFIPSFLGLTDHRWLPVIMYPLDRRDDLTDSCFGLEEGKREKKLLSKKTEFSNQVSQHRNQTWIISSEHLQARLRTMQEIEKLKTFLFDYFEEVNVVCYMRKPIEAVVSLWSTAAKHGLGWEELPLPGSHIDRLCNHKHTDQLWSSSFGKSFIARLYTKTELCGESIIDDFLEYAQIDPSGLESSAEMHNSSMSEAAIKTISFINKKISPSLKSEAERIDRGALIRGVEEAFSSLPKFVPSPEEIEAYYEFYKESDDYILKKYFPEKIELWPPSRKAGHKKKLSVENNADIFEQFASLLVDIWLQERNKCADLRQHADALGNEIRMIKSSRAYRCLRLLSGIGSKFIRFVKNKV